MTLVSAYTNPEGLWAEYLDKHMLLQWDTVEHNLPCRAEMLIPHRTAFRCLMKWHKKRDTVKYRGMVIRQGIDLRWVVSYKGRYGDFYEVTLAALTQALSNRI